jgi:hypothetical protein
MQERHTTESGRRVLQFITTNGAFPPHKVKDASSLAEVQARAQRR